MFQRRNLFPRNSVVWKATGITIRIGVNMGYFTDFQGHHNVRSEGFENNFTEDYDYAATDNYTSEEYYTYFNNTLLEAMDCPLKQNKTVLKHPIPLVVFTTLYIVIFIIGLLGNVVICYIVGRNKAMQTVTNFFIANLALSDILLCVLGIPFTPIYSFMANWVFGKMLCHLVSYAQGVSVYVSALTLTSIAVDRYFVILYPFRPRMRLTTCLLIIAFIWIFALSLTLPYGYHMTLYETNETIACGELWDEPEPRKWFGVITSTLQFIVPFFVTTYAYTRVCIRLQSRAKAKPGMKSIRSEEIERQRKRRTNRMLIAMVIIFGASWLPINMVNLYNDLFPIECEAYHEILFFVVHWIAMSSVCYNVFLYAWLNDSFRKEFKLILLWNKSNIMEKNRNRSNKNKQDSLQSVHISPENEHIKDGSLRTVHTYVTPLDGEPLEPEDLLGNVVAEFKVSTEAIEFKPSSETNNKHDV
ncbi:prolactin-releasing peptide receptor-like isoform X1 [Artemia franciscana]|uniref:prolactin-releasing peptide receptor-like isoform X1 n=2 Tax=Artemia franciscana TaxID=6661 RepID=UPI0032DA48C3